MRRDSTHHIAVRRSAAAAVVLLATVLAGCSGRQRVDTSGAASSVADTSGPVTTLPPEREPATTQPVVTDPESTPPDEAVVVAPPTALGAAETPAGAYPSVIVDETVDNPAFDEVEAGITERITAAGLPGASLLVVQHGVVIEQEAWMGYDLDVQVPIASASKWFTAATIMSLVDDGLLELDAPISAYAPQLVGRVGTITMRQLLSFTSGLVDNDRLSCDEDPTSTLQACAAEFLRHGVVHTPGEAFRYGSEHMIVAAAVAEAVTGERFAELFLQRIAEPLGMDRTWFLQTGDPRRDPHAVEATNPAGGAVSTLTDYGRFLEMIVHDGVAPDGTRLLSPESIAEMQHDQIADARYASAARYRVLAKTPYGLGEWLDRVDGDGQGVIVSSDGKFGFRPWIDHANDLYGVYLVDDREGAGFVEGDPDGTAPDADKVPTSGLWVFEWVAAAVGGTWE